MSEINQIQIFQTADGQVQLEVSLEQDSAWLSQAQMTELFGRERSVITRHINNVFKEGELVKKSNVQKIHIANSDKPVAFYSLDVIISVGYRVKSQRGVQFRQWATNVLKQHLVDGYSINQRRLQERGVEFEQAVALLSQTLANQQLVAPEGEEVLRVISEYARSWSLLQGYDEQSLADISVKQGEMRALELDDVFSAVASLKKELIAKGEATELFAQLRAMGWSRLLRQ
jgi:Virulence protein RhuM family